MSWMRRARPTGAVRTCGPCRRALRRAARGRSDDDHTCYGAVLGVDTPEATTWVSCPCACQDDLAEQDEAVLGDDTVARVLRHGTTTPADDPGPVTHRTT